VRFDLSWEVVQPSGPDTWHWDGADRAIAAARARGLEVLPILAYTPAWARPAGTTDKHAPADVGAFARFAAQAVARYAPQGVHAWEIWNEENVSAFWRPAPDPQAYARLLGAASAAVKAIDPGATVLVGGLASAGPTLDWQAPNGSEISPWRFLRSLYELGAAGTFDAVADHPYAALPQAPDADLAGNSFRNVADLHALMASFGDGGKRIWATETGAYTGTAPGAVSEATQADYVSRYLRAWRAWDFTGPLFFYSLRDLGTNLRDREQNWGFLGVDRRAKPALQVLRGALGR
jgi:hypothetical protein